MPHIALTKPRQEKRAVANLERQGYRTFLPLCRKNKTAKPSPLFPRYMFFWNGELPCKPVFNTPGITRVLRGKDYEPLNVSEAIVEEIRNRMNKDGGAVILDPTPPKRIFRLGQKIIITNGTHSGLTGLYVRQDKERITTLLNMFGRQVLAVISEKNIA